MKKIAVASLILLMSINSSWSQSSVNLFGLLDVNVRNIRVGDTSKTEMHNSSVAGSRIGIRGVEDLGGGLNAGFWLESAISPDSGGTAPKFFHRRSTISLNGPWGEVRLGRDLTATFQGFVYYDPFAVNGVGSVQNVFSGPGYTLGSGATTSSRTDNAISYFLPKGLGGLNAHLMYAPGEKVPGNEYKGVRVGYADETVDVAIAHSSTEAVGTGKFKVLTLGGTYDLKFAKLSLVHIRNTWSPLTEKVWLLGASVPIGANGTLRGSYVRKDAQGGGKDANDANQIALGYLHRLSKRTMLYGTYSHLENHGISNSVVGNTIPGVPGKSSRGAEFGIVHGF